MKVRNRTVVGGGKDSFMEEGEVKNKDSTDNVMNKIERVKPQMRMTRLREENETLHLYQERRKRYT